MTSGPYNDNPKPNPRSASRGRQHIQTQNLYYPSIFRYKCRGAFHVSSDDTGSAGVCQGIQSRLEHVRDLQRSTRDEAASAFLSAANYPTDLPDEGDTPHAEALRSLLQTQALIYNENNEDSTTKKGNDLDPDNPWNDWSCYGSTEVHLLVLRDISDNKETIAGVAPECALGLSIRDVGTPTSGGVVGTIRMGPIEVNLVGDYYDEQNPSTADGRQQHNKKNNRSNSSTSQITSPSQPTMDKPVSNAVFYEKFMKASRKLSYSMQHNALFLKNELSDEFPSRMVDGAKRVVGQFEKTTERTLKLMKSVYHFWRDDHDD